MHIEFNPCKYNTCNINLIRFYLKNLILTLNINYKTNFHRIGVECCITGNVGGQIVKQYSEHPIRQMFVSGVRVNINSDNQLLSGDFDRIANTINDITHLRYYIVYYCFTLFL
jgi:hypothetical protein